VCFLTDNIKGNSNHEIPRFGLAQSRDFRTEKRSGTWDPGIRDPGIAIPILGI